MDCNLHEKKNKQVQKCNFYENLPPMSWFLVFSYIAFLEARFRGNQTLFLLEGRPAWTPFIRGYRKKEGHTMNLH